MTEHDRGRFAVILKITADLYGIEPLSRDALELFFVLMAKYNIGQFEKALHDHMLSSRFMPRPSDIVSRIEGTPEERAMLAWPTVVNAIRRIGGCNSVAFPTAEYIFAISKMEGWPKLCSSMFDDEIKWRGKDFKSFYVFADGRVSWENSPEKIRVARYCAGLYELNNLANGFALPEVFDAVTNQPIPGFRDSVIALQGKIAPMFDALASSKRRQKKWLIQGTKGCNVT